MLRDVSGSCSVTRFNNGVHVGWWEGKQILLFVQRDRSAGAAQPAGKSERTDLHKDGREWAINSRTDAGSDTDTRPGPQEAWFMLPFRVGLGFVAVFF